MFEAGEQEADTHKLSQILSLPQTNFLRIDQIFFAIDSIRMLIRARTLFPLQEFMAVKKNASTLHSAAQ